MGGYVGDRLGTNKDGQADKLSRHYGDQYRTAVDTVERAGTSISKDIRQSDLGKITGFRTEEEAEDEGQRASANYSEGIQKKSKADKGTASLQEKKKNKSTGKRALSVNK